jgi:uncharacterized protein (DUF4415 family)
LIIPTPQEDAEIQRGIDADPETPELDAAWFARARPARVVMGDAFVDAMEARRRRVERAKAKPAGPKRRATKTTISVRLDDDLVATLRASGPRWQSRVNAILRKSVLAD